MAVATPVFHSPLPAAAAGAVRFRPTSAVPRCINQACDSHSKAVFRTEDPGDGAVCTSCGMQQIFGGFNLILSKSIREREHDDARAVDAARAAAVQVRTSGDHRSSDALEARVANADRRAVDEGLRVANRNAKIAAKAAAQDLHPSVLEGVRNSQQMQELRDWAKQVINSIKKSVPVMTSEQEIKFNLARAEGSVMGESAEYIASLPVPLSYEQRVLAADVPVQMDTSADEANEDDEPDSKRQKVDNSASSVAVDSAALIAETEARINAYVRSEGRLSREAYGKHAEIMNAKLAEVLVKVEHPIDGTIEMRGNDVRKAIVQRDLKQQVAGQAAAAAAADGEDQPSEYHVMQSLRRVRVVQDTLLPRLESLFRW